MDHGIGNWASRRAFIDPDRTALVDAETGRRRTYREIEARSNCLARSLRKQGIRPGDRVALLLLNSPEVIELWFAVAKLNAIVVPINYRLSIADVGYILADSGAVILAHSSSMGTLAKSASEQPGVRVHELLSVPESAERREGAGLGLESLVAAGSPNPLDSDVPGGAVAAIMYTSGTTGRPKGAMLTHDNLLWNAINTITAGDGLTRDDISVTSAPFFHIGGLGVITLPLFYAGGTTIIQEVFDAAICLRLMQDEKATVAFQVASMWAEISRLQDFDEYDLSPLRYAMSGGMPCPLPISEFYQSKGWKFVDGFGMTETAPLVTLLAAEHVAGHPGSAGRPVMHVEARIVDENDRTVPADEVGELVLRGPNIFTGYWGLPEQTAEAFRGGWFHTGDLGRQDVDGFITLVDRKKDMIITGGENVYPIEVEQVMARHRAIHEVAVIGLPDERWGEVVVAVVVPVDSPPPPDEIIAWTRNQIAGFKTPRRIVFIDQLPRTATGKLLKRELRKDYSGSSEAFTR